MLGSVLRFRWLGLTLLVTWAFGVVCGSVHPLGHRGGVPGDGRASSGSPRRWACGSRSPPARRARPWPSTLGTLLFLNGGYLLCCVPLRAGPGPTSTVIHLAASCPGSPRGPVQRRRTTGSSSNSWPAPPSPGSSRTGSSSRSCPRSRRSSSTPPGRASFDGPGHRPVRRRGAAPDRRPARPGRPPAVAGGRSPSRLDYGAGSGPSPEGRPDGVPRRAGDDPPHPSRRLRPPRQRQEQPGRAARGRVRLRPGPHRRDAPRGDPPPATSSAAASRPTSPRATSCPTASSSRCWSRP